MHFNNDEVLTLSSDDEIEMREFINISDDDDDLTVTREEQDLTREQEPMTIDDEELEEVSERLEKLQPVEVAPSQPQQQQQQLKPLFPSPPSSIPLSTFQSKPIRSSFQIHQTVLPHTTYQPQSQQQQPYPKLPPPPILNISPPVVPKQNVRIPRTVPENTADQRPGILYVSVAEIQKPKDKAPSVRSSAGTSSQKPTPSTSSNKQKKPSTKQQPPLKKSSPKISRVKATITIPAASIDPTDPVAKSKTICDADRNHMDTPNNWLSNRRNPDKSDYVYGHVGDVLAVYESKKDLYVAKVHQLQQKEIHGFGATACASIVLNEIPGDHLDYGNVVVLAGTEEMNAKEQTLERNNLSLAYSWQEKKPIRIIRGENFPSGYAPEQGFRYDGLYFVTAYWSERTDEGRLIYRFRLCRMSNQPALPEEQSNWEERRQQASPPTPTPTQSKKTSDRHQDIELVNKTRRARQRVSYNEQSDDDDTPMPSESVFVPTPHQDARNRFFNPNVSPGIPAAIRYADQWVPDYRIHPTLQKPASDDYIEMCRTMDIASGLKTLEEAGFSDIRFLEVDPSVQRITNPAFTQRKPLAQTITFDKYLEYLQRHVEKPQTASTQSETQYLKVLIQQHRAQREEFLKQMTAETQKSFHLRMSCNNVNIGGVAKKLNGDKQLMFSVEDTETVRNRLRAKLSANKPQEIHL